MIVTLTFKTPDVMNQIHDQIGYDASDEADNRLEEIENFINRYVQWSDYVTIEFDSEKQTVQVLPCGA